MTFFSDEKQDNGLQGSGALHKYLSQKVEETRSARE
jgi:hypothetical protein